MTMFVNVTNQSYMVIIITMKFSEENKLKCRKIARKKNCKVGVPYQKSGNKESLFIGGALHFAKKLSMISLN